MKLIYNSIDCVRCCPVDFVAVRVAIVKVQRIVTATYKEATSSTRDWNADPADQHRRCHGECSGAQPRLSAHGHVLRPLGAHRDLLSLIRSHNRTTASRTFAHHKSTFDLVKRSTMLHLNQKLSASADVARSARREAGNAEFTWVRIFSSRTNLIDSEWGRSGRPAPGLLTPPTLQSLSTLPRGQARRPLVAGIDPRRNGVCDDRTRVLRRR
jgi:hypothetical protein